jgi:hypothetical protein
MSGDNHDILDLIGESERPKVSKLISLMSTHRPRVDIDRDFQRELKTALMESTKKRSFSWYPWLSSLGVVATSFLVLIGMWNMWWGRDQASPELYTSTPPEVAMYSESTVMNANMAMTPASDMSDTKLSSITSPSEDSTVWSSEKEVETLAKVATPPSNTRTVDRAWTNTANTDTASTSDLDITGDIASISADIDAIIEESTPASTGWVDLASMTSVSISAPTLDVETFALPSYPEVMPTYHKNMATWTADEILSRSGSGITKVEEKTLSPARMRELLTKTGAMGEVTVDYRIEKSAQQTHSSLVPVLKYKNLDSEWYFHLIEVYSLR